MDQAKPTTTQSLTNAEYRQLKQRMIKYEEKNYNTIAILPCSGDKGWCEIGDHSALIYYYKVCKELNIDVNFDSDSNSFYYQFKYGKIKTRGFDTVRKRLKKVGLFNYERSKNGCVFFYLKNPITKSEMEKLWKTEEARRDKIGRIIDVTFADPTLHQMMLKVAARLHQICLRRLDKLSSATNGKRMVGFADAMLRKYYEVTRHGKTIKPKDWQDMIKICNQLIVELQIVSELGLWTRQKCVDIAKEILDIKERLENSYGTSKS